MMTILDSFNQLIELKLELDQNNSSTITYYGLTNDEYARLCREIGNNATGETIRTWLDDNQISLHRTDGPAVKKKFSDGSSEEEWFFEGKFHHTEGPAIVYEMANGNRTEWWYTDGNLTKKERITNPANIPGVEVNLPQP